MGAGREKSPNVLAILFLLASTASSFSITDLRHDCTGPDEDPTIRRDLSTSTVYRLKSPKYKSCQHKLDKAFKWYF